MLGRINKMLSNPIIMCNRKNTRKRRANSRMKDYVRQKYLHKSKRKRKKKRILFSLTLSICFLYVITIIL